MEDSLKQWHQYCAIENNNKAWELTNKQERDQEDNVELFNLAHSAFYHWKIVGGQLEEQRAKMLLAETHALLGHSKSALDYAIEMKEYFEANQCPDWELAFAHTIFAQALQASEKYDLLDEAIEVAQQSIDKIKDKDDQALVLQTFSHLKIKDQA